MDVTEAKQPIHDAIQRTATTHTNLDGSVLIGWIVVAEWMDAAGNRWLSRIGSAGDATRQPPEWQWQGYLYNALHEQNWPQDDAADDERDA